MNTKPVGLIKHTELLNRFNEEYQEKLKVYTTQELYYVYMLLQWSPKDPGVLSTGDMMVLTLKSKMIRYIEGKESKALHPGVWRTLGSRFGRKYALWLEAA